MVRQEAFWDWFIAHQKELLEIENGDERLLNELAAELQRIDPNLTFEIGIKGQKREFVISAGGIKGAFPAVISLMNAAPILKQWQIIAFRPRRTPINAVELGGKRVEPADVRFTLLDNGSTAGIYLFIPGFHEDDIALKQIGYLLLDEALGEFDVESHLGLIKIFTLEAQTKGDRYALPDLPSLFDQLISRLKAIPGCPHSWRRF